VALATLQRFENNSVHFSTQPEPFLTLEQGVSGSFSDKNGSG
jgi:hypothetical protein